MLVKIVTKIGKVKKDFGRKIGPVFECLENDFAVKLESFFEYLWVGRKGDGGAVDRGREKLGKIGMTGLGSGFEWRGSSAAAKRNLVKFAFPSDLDGVANRKGVDTGGADTVETAGNFLGVAVKFAAGMEGGEDDLDGRFLVLGHDVDRDTPAIIGDSQTVVLVYDHPDVVSKAG